MPVLPRYQTPKVIQAAAFTPADSDDIQVANRILIEKWELFYPRVGYQQLDFVPTLAVEAGETAISGTAPATVADWLTGETVPYNSDEDFVQPHGGETEALEVDATDDRKYQASIVVPTFLRLQDASRALTLRGERFQRTFRFMWPTALLDYYGVLVNTGDVLTWGGNVIEIKEAFVPENGYWKYTNIPMYVAAWGAYRQFGS